VPYARSVTNGTLIYYATVEAAGHAPPWMPASMPGVQVLLAKPSSTFEIERGRIEELRSAPPTPADWIRAP
jgi:hypothetical protein